MKQLYKHQERFLAKNPDRALLLWEMGTGKTIAACEWLKKRPDRTALIICPKSIVGKWQRDREEWGVKNAGIVSMSQLGKVDMSRYNALVIDEAQNFASPLFTPGRSQRTTIIYEFLRAHPDTHVLLLTATPVRSTAYNIQTLAAFIGKLWPIKEFQKKFFYFTDLFGRWHWEPRADWRKNIRPYVEEISDIVLMQDCADIPTQHERVVDVPWSTKDENSLNKQYLEPAAEWHARHRAEQSDAKYDALMEIVSGYRKAIVVCHYTEQIESYQKKIGRERQVFVLNGAVKDQDKVIEEAKAADDCIFIVQASMGAGFDASEFSVVVFASMSFKFTDLIQMQGRVKRLNNLHENIFYYLLGGKNDQSVYNTIKKGHDFHPPSYMAK